MCRIIWLIVEKAYGRTKIFVHYAERKKVHLIEHFNDIQLLKKKNGFINGHRHQVKLLLKGFKRK